MHPGSLRRCEKHIHPHFSRLSALATGQVVVAEADGGMSASEERRVAVFDPAAPQHSSAGVGSAGGRKKVISGSQHTSAAGTAY